jgi:chromosome segregation ATPase
MTQVNIAVAPDAARQSLPAPAAVSVDHLRRILDKQPACLMRIGIDGLILAANDAAIELLGAKQPAQVLGGSLMSWIVSAHQDAWRDFARSVGGGASQSLECDLNSVSGNPRSVVFHGIPLVDHADGIPSLIVGARDASAVRRLEAALHESETLRQALVAEQRGRPVENVSTELKDLEARLEASEADRGRLEQALSRLPQLEQLLKQGRLHLQDLRAKLDEANSERDRLSARLGEREAANEQLWTEQAELQQALSDQQQRELFDLQAQLQETIVARDKLVAALNERAAAYDRLRQESADQHHACEERDHEVGRLTARLNEVTAERDQLVTQLADSRLMSARLDETAAERQHLESQLAERTTEHARLLADQDERHRIELQHQEQMVSTLRAELEQATAARERAAAELSELAAAHQQHLAEHTDLHQSVESHQHQMSELRAQYDQATTDRERIANQLRESEAARERLANDHESKRAHLEAERANLAEKLGAALSQQKESEKALADFRVELQSFDLAVRRIEPLAAAGRLAADVARELLSAITDMDTRAACLLAECPVESSTRKQIEQLRGESVRASSLARQILEAGHATQPPERT